MKTANPDRQKQSIGIIGLGAFGRLVARHAAPHFEVFAYDIAPDAAATAAGLGVTATSLRRAASCDVVVIATPVPSFAEILPRVAQYCRPGALVMDVGSVKTGPSALMREWLPETVDVVATHPLFGPQSARDGLAGLKIAICPLRGDGHRRLAWFLRRHFGLRAIVATPDEHDREAATVQGLVHLIAKVIANMGDLPTRMTTRSFDLLVEAVSMVRHDAPEVFEAIEKANPYSRAVRRRFFELANRLDAELEKDARHTHPGEPSKAA